MTLPPQVFDLLLNKLVKISSGRGHNIFHTLHTKDYLKIDFKVLIINLHARGVGGGDSLIQMTGLLVGNF